MAKMDFSPEAIRARNEQFKKSDEYKEFVVPLIKSLGKND